MHLTGLPLLEALKQRYPSVRAFVDAWRGEVEGAIWTSHEDIRTRYLSASFPSPNRVIFGLQDNLYLIAAQVRYANINGLVRIQWAGSTADFNKLVQS